ncbi:hypothetical protein [uncultured Bilophila sp.]|uniref:hypothetical protein n=1 Tax=uncultured Bilophila sp. TaxID=529385 RepID=UPI0026479155|nr:hypothetical protein [uncultured Bilophila sp.]
MREVSRAIMVGACELACRYPELSLEDVAGDARQLAEMVARYGMKDARKEESVLMAACWFIGADRNLSPHGAIDKALMLWGAVKEEEGQR